MKKSSFGVILPAAGSGTRFGSDKLFYSLGGRPVLDRTVYSFQNAATVSCIVIVTRKESIDLVRELTASYSKVIAVVEGGATRGESVLCGVAALPDSVTHISIHDGARPLISPQEIDRLHKEAERYGAVCAGLPVYDTVQQVDAEGFIVATPDRSSLVAAATPQIFEKDLYLSACRATEGQSFTDDAGLVRAAGGRVKMVLCQCENFKITTPADARRAEAYYSE